MELKVARLSSDCRRGSGDCALLVDKFLELGTSLHWSLIRLRVQGVGGLDVNESFWVFVDKNCLKVGFFFMEKSM
jgi:hypothetical protein